MNQRLANQKGRDVWLLTLDEKTASSVHAVLNADSGLAVKGVCSNLPELVQAMEREPTPAVVVDIDAQPSRTMRDLESVVGRFPDTRFVVLSSRFSNELILEAMQIGARHFVLKQSIESDLPGILRRLVVGTGRGAGSRPEPEGHIVTVLSAGGGCGATTICVNLAHEISLIGPDRRC